MASETARTHIVDRVAQRISVRALRGMRVEELLDAVGGTKGTPLQRFDSEKAVALPAVSQLRREKGALKWPVPSPVVS